MKELIIGCGRKTELKLVSVNGDYNYHEKVTLDINPDHNPDFVHNLEILPYPFEDNSFDEIHAYEVLEHTGAQGDYEFFFKQFTELWRIMKNGGHLIATVPRWDSLWAFGDPSHKRVINQGTLVFLSQKSYRDQVGVTAMSDFRYIYKGDFETVHCQANGESLIFILKAIKEN